MQIKWNDKQPGKQCVIVRYSSGENIVIYSLNDTNDNNVEIKDYFTALYFKERLFFK